MIALVALLPRLQVAAAVRTDGAAGLAQSSGQSDRLDASAETHLDFSVWLSWDVSRWLDDSPSREASALQRDEARRRAERWTARVALADRARSAASRARVATTPIDAAQELLEQAEALAATPDAP